MRSTAPALLVVAATCQRTRISPPSLARAAPRLSKESDEGDAILPWVPVVEYVALPSCLVHRLPSVAVPQEPFAGVRPKVSWRIVLPWGDVDEVIQPTLLKTYVALLPSGSVMLLR